MWFTGVEVEQETSAPPPKKILDPPLQCLYLFCCLECLQCFSQILLSLVNQRDSVPEGDWFCEACTATVCLAHSLSLSLIPVRIHSLEHASHFSR